MKKRYDNKQIAKALKHFGFFHERQKGSHMVYRHCETRRVCVVVRKHGELRRGTMKNILLQAGISQVSFEEFFK